MRYRTVVGLLAVILTISPGVVAQEEKETPSPARKASSEAEPSRGRTTAPEKTKSDRPGRRFGGDEGLPADPDAFPMEDYEEGAMDDPVAATAAQAQTQASTTMDYLAAIGTLALAFAVVTAAAVMRVRRVLSADATFKLISLALIVVAGLSLLRSGYAHDLMAPMTTLLGTALGFIFGKQMGSTVPEGAPGESPPVVTPTI